MEKKAAKKKLKPNRLHLTAADILGASVEGNGGPELQSLNLAANGLDSAAYDLQRKRKAVPGSDEG